jgi:hypothetical protein
MNEEKGLVFGLLAHSFGAVLPLWLVVVTINPRFLRNKRPASLPAPRINFADRPPGRQKPEPAR